jgi:hypothetical protein
MPSPRGYKNIPIKPRVLQRLQQKWDKERAQLPQINKTFGGFVNDLLEDVLDKDEFLRVYAPYLSLEGYSYNCLYIKDAKRQVTAEIYRYDNKIKCTLDDSFDCEHVHFALAIPEVAKLGLKKPA